MAERPNLVVIMTDQQRADITRREGFPLDTTPFLDSLALQQGTWFNHAYTPMPVCSPARVSMLTGRYPNATHVRTNHNEEDVFYETDLIDVLHQQGYVTALSGKNHSYLTPEKMDFWYELSHNGGWGGDRTDDEKGFDAYLTGLSHRADFKPTAFPLETQGPYRAVTKATEWLDTVEDQPFFLWLSFAEPHNPYQVPEPYFSMFPPETLPPTLSNVSALEEKSFKYQWTRQIGELAFPDYAEQLPRARANYCGMLRLIDDQIKRFFDYLDANGLRENTIILILSDHGDFVGEYGLVRKGPELPEVLTRVPFVAVGPGVPRSSEPHPAYISLVDIMPTLCEIAGAEIPAGVQGRSLLPILTGQPYPEADFASAYSEQGFGGLHYTADDPYDPQEDGISAMVGFDELNGWSQSGTMRMVRKGDWKLIMDMQGAGQLYNLADDPVELVNLYGKPECLAIQQELLADLVVWLLRVQDPLPHPRRRYKFKTPPHGYWTTGK